MATTRVFELRTYRSNPGKLDALRARFADHTVALFARHSIELVAFFDVADGDRAADTLTYLLAFPDREFAEGAWAAFRADPDWIAAKAASEVEGELAAHIDSTFLTPTDYSPIR